jgi:hypothetical protein
LSAFWDIVSDLKKAPPSRAAKEYAPALARNTGSWRETLLHLRREG